MILVHKILYEASMSMYGVLMYGVYGDGLFGAAATHTANILLSGCRLLAVCIGFGICLGRASVKKGSPTM
jgi:hypothetical protein